MPSDVAGELSAPSGARRFLASVDDAGDVAFVVGECCTIGHATDGRADIQFVGDLDPLHATLALAVSFHEGASWTLRCAPGARPPRVRGDAIAADEDCALRDGDSVEFGTAASFTIRRPDDASSSIVLELTSGTHFHGATNVVVMAPGPAARIRIGSRAGRHLLVPGLAHDVVATASIDSVTWSCEGGARLASPDAVATEELAMPLPVTSRVHVAFGAAPDRVPPFGIALAPIRE